MDKNFQKNICFWGGCERGYAATKVAGKTGWIWVMYNEQEILIRSKVIDNLINWVNEQLKIVRHYYDNSMVEQ